MKKNNIIGVIAVFATWILIISVGSVIWDGLKDEIQGIVFGLGITAVACGLAFSYISPCDEYDEYGDYKGR